MPEIAEGGPGRHLGWSWGPAQPEMPGVPEPRAQPGSGLLLAGTWTRASGQRVALAPATPARVSFQTHPAWRAALGPLPAASLGPQCVPSFTGCGPGETVRVQRMTRRSCAEGLGGPLREDGENWMPRRAGSFAAGLVPTC